MSIHRIKLRTIAKAFLFSILVHGTGFLSTPAMSAEGWRVIAENPQFPTDDVIVAFCSVTDAAYDLPDDPAAADCTPAIQRALDDASAAGGGTVFLPEGDTAWRAC